MGKIQVKQPQALDLLSLFFYIPPLSSVSQNTLKFYQQLTGEERRINFIFDDFHFCRSRVIELDMTENRIFTLFLVGTISNVLVMEIGWTDVGSGGFLSNTSCD
jgi:hypothetical protein